jgi:hypothetical protein
MIVGLALSSYKKTVKPIYLNKLQKQLKSILIEGVSGIKNMPVSDTTWHYDVWLHSINLFSKFIIGNKVSESVSCSCLCEYS